MRKASSEFDVPSRKLFLEGPKGQLSLLITFQLSDVLTAFCSVAAHTLSQLTFQLLSKKLINYGYIASVIQSLSHWGLLSREL